MISPCVKQCHIPKDGDVCTGCGRTLDEIRDWSHMTDDQRQVVMDRLRGVSDESHQF